MLWKYIAFTLAVTHITVFCITVYLHRYQAHRSIELHPAVSHFCRFWLWLTTGIITKAWTAIHRKHHAKCETKDDPHSPQVLGISKVLWEGAELYRAEAKNVETLNRYGQGTPDDWLERNVYTPHSNKGYLLMLLIDIIFFGLPGLTIWAIQMMWTPFFAAGIINGIGHYWGYRNFDCPDASTNIFPIGILIGGEELHNNHHAYPTSAQFSTQWWEFDLGWCYIRLLSLLGLAKIRRRIPKIVINKNKHQIDLDTLKAIIMNRYPILTKFKKSVLLPLAKDNSVSITHLKTVSLLKDQFQEIWKKAGASNNELLEYLHDWCVRAESTSLKPLKEFVAYIRGYTCLI